MMGRQVLGEGGTKQKRKFLSLHPYYNTKVSIKQERVAINLNFYR